MRITLVIHSMSAGGAERVMSTMANYWASKGWEVTLLTFIDRETPPFYDLDSCIRYVPLGIASDSADIAATLKNTWQRFWVLRSAIAQSRPQAVISFMTSTNVLTVLATRGRNFPVLVSERNDPNSCDNPPHWKLLREWTYSWADRIVVQTQRAANYFPAPLQSRICQIPNPVLIPPQLTGASQEHLPQRSIVAVGRLEFQKGFDLLLKAFANLKDIYPDWTLTIFGEGSLRTELVDLANQLGISDRIDLPGKVKNIYHKLQTADLFVMPSRFEGFPNALCEAMACGLPVISTDCPQGPREIIRQDIDGLLVPTENVLALTTAMQQLMADDEKRADLAKQAPNIVERFSLEKIMGQWEAAIPMSMPTEYLYDKQGMVR